MNKENNQRLGGSANDPPKRFPIFPLMPDDVFVNKSGKILNEENLFNTELASKLPKDVKVLIGRLLSVHYTGTLHKHPSLVNPGEEEIELSIPDPELLKHDGPKELRSQHLYVNLTKYIKGDHKAAARSVKTGQFYYIDKLLTMTPLLDREAELGWNPSRYTRHIKTRLSTFGINGFGSEDNEDISITSDIISPGELIPITELPADHPAVLYLRARGYNIKALEEQFNCSYCVKENPQFKHIYGRDSEEKMAEFNPLICASPEGRIVFFSEHFGLKAIWQARVIEQTLGEKKYFFDGQHYQCVALKDNISGKFSKPAPLFPLSTSKRKYVIAPGGKASNCLLGFDAAIKWNKDNKTIRKVIGICEGVLDAARLGPPFCSIMGAHISNGQMKTIVDNFDKIYYICDHDKAGESLKTSIEYHPLVSHLDYVEELTYPDVYKDVGEIDPTTTNIIDQIKSKLLTENTLESNGENDLIIE